MIKKTMDEWKEDGTKEGRKKMGIRKEENGSARRKWTYIRRKERRKEGGRWG